MKFGFLTATLPKGRLAGLVLTLLPLVIPQASGETSAPMGKPMYELTVDVRLFHGYSAGTLAAGREVVVWLVPTQTTQEARLNSELPHYRMIHHHKIFEPRLLVVPVGAVVEFPNYDPWFHNVFSNRFDLGLYGPGAQRAVRFDRAGASYLFCSLHPETMGIVLTVDSKYFGVSDKTGHLSIGKVPSGTYILHVWYENATPQALEALRRVIFVGDDSRSLPSISVALFNRIPMTGRN